MARPTFAETEAVSERTLLRMLVSGQKPDGSDAGIDLGTGGGGGTSSAVLQVLDSDDTTPLALGGSAERPLLAELDISTSSKPGSSGNVIYVASLRLLEALQDAVSIGFRTDADTWEPWRNEAVDHIPVNVQLPSSAAEVKRVGRITAYNPTSAAAFLHFYDAASTPSVGTDTPKWTEAIPAGASIPVPEVAPFPIANKLWIAATTSHLKAGSTSPSTALMVCLGVK